MNNNIHPDNIVLSIDINDLNDENTVDSLFKDIYSFLFKEGAFSLNKELFASVHNGSYSRNIKLSNFITSLAFIRNFAKYKIADMDYSFFVESKIDSLKFYINRLIGHAKNHNIPLMEIKQAIANAIATISDISIQVNETYGATINLYSIGKLAQRNSEFNDLLNFDIPNNLQFKDIEDLISSKLARMVIILEEEDTPLKYLLKGGAINVKQLGQAFLNIGLKPDLMGRIIPEPVNTSFLRGLRNETDALTNAIGARKALVVNHKQVRKSGYLARKMALLTIDTFLNTDIEDCGTTHYLNAEIPNEATLRRLLRKLDSTGTEIDIKNKEYIDGTIQLRSPIYCASKKGICKTCFGRMVDYIGDMHIGINGILILTEKITQMLLSSKHLLQTKSDRIQWSEEFLTAFTQDKASIYSNEATNIEINRDDIMEDDEGNFFTRVVTATCSSRKVVIYSPKKLFLNDDLIEQYEVTTKDIINSRINGEDMVFYIKTENIELSTSLKKLIALLETVDHNGLKNDIDGIYNHFISYLNESGIGLNSVHAECILYALMRTPDLQRPDFSQEEKPEFNVLSMSNAILSSNSMAVNLSFEQIKKQLKLTNTFNKDRSSILDGLFV